MIIKRQTDDVKLSITIKDSAGLVIDPALFQNILLDLYNASTKDSIALFSMNVAEGYTLLTKNGSVLEAYVDSGVTEGAEVGIYNLAVSYLVADPDFIDSEKRTTNAFNMLRLISFNETVPSTECSAETYDCAGYLASILVDDGDTLSVTIELGTVSLGGDAGDGYLLAANNLSEIVSAEAARSNLGLGNVDNTRDADKPVSTAQQAEIDTRLVAVVSDSTLSGAGTAASPLHAETGGSGDMLSTNNLSDVADATISRTNLGLGNVDNTSDADKPVSTAVTLALGDKADSLGVDENYVTDAEKILLGNTSGSNTGDQVAGDFSHNSLAGLDLGTEYLHITQAQRDKLNLIQAGAEVNNMSDAEVLDLTDGGDSTLHYHASDRARTNHTGTQLAETISDFNLAVSSNSDVTANTAKVGITTIQSDEIAANTAKVGITTIQSDEIIANTAKVGITTVQSDEIIANTAKVSYPVADSTKVGFITITQAVDLDTLESNVSANNAKVGITTAQSDAIIDNTAKVTNATHTGDVTGSGILTIADGVITNSKMAADAIGLVELSATGTPSSSTFLRGDNTWAVPAGGSGDMLSTNNLSDVADATISRTNLGLGNVDNTSDADKPISSAVQTALAAKIETESFIVVCSDVVTDLTTGVKKAVFPMPFAFTISSVKADVDTAPVGSTLLVDINEAGVSILSTVISIDAGETSSSTAATPPVISDSSVAEGAIISVDIDQIGATTAGKALVVTIIGSRT